MQAVPTQVQLLGQDLFNGVYLGTRFGSLFSRELP